MEENNNPPPQEAVNKLMRELENTRSFFNRKPLLLTSSRLNLMSKTTKSFVFIKVDEMTIILRKPKKTV